LVGGGGGTGVLVSDGGTGVLVSDGGTGVLVADPGVLVGAGVLVLVGVGDGPAVGVLVAVLVGLGVAVGVMVGVFRERVMQSLTAQVWLPASGKVKSSWTQIVPIQD
jgi:hypothetical protein